MAHSRRLNGGLGGFCSSSARSRLALGVTTALVLTKNTSPAASKSLAVERSSSRTREAFPSAASLSRSRRS